MRHALGDGGRQYQCPAAPADCRHCSNRRSVAGVRMLRAAARWLLHQCCYQLLASPIGVLHPLVGHVWRQPAVAIHPVVPAVRRAPVRMRLGSRQRGTMACRKEGAGFRLLTLCFKHRLHSATHEMSAKPKMPIPPTSDARQNHSAVWRDRGRQSCAASCAALA